MKEFKYKALDGDGHIARGKITALNELDLEERLHDIGLELIHYTAITKSQYSGIFHTIKTKDILILCVHLAELEKAGVPILESLLDLRDALDNPKMQQVIHEIYEEVKNGKMLSEAFKNYPKIFDGIFISLIHAGENTGNLGEVLEYLVEHIKWNLELENSIKKASYYPIGMLILMTLMVSGMMVMVIPEVTSFLREQDLELPQSTKILISVSDFFVNQWHVLLISITSLITTYIIANKKSQKFRYIISHAKLFLPFIGSISRKIEMARFCRFFSITYTSGIGILECIDISGNVVQNEYLKYSIYRISKFITNGVGLTESLKLVGEFPNLVIRLFRIGEESGDLNRALKNVNMLYDREIKDGVEELISAIKPTMMMILGLLIAWIAVAIFGPIYGNLGNI